MNLEEIKDCINKFSYKPGWSVFVLDTFQSHGYEIVIQSNPVKDATGRSETPNSIMSKTIVEYNHFKTEKQIIRYIQRKIEALEKHEMKEWFKFEGKLLDDPHPGITKKEHIFNWGDR